jgi:hypothetical protein
MESSGNPPVETMTDDELARNDLAAQIEAARHAAANAPEAESLHDLGVLLLESYDRYGGPALVAEALGLLQQAVKISAADGTGWNGPRGALGAALSTQYKIDGNPATLDEAIDLLSRAIPGGPVIFSTSPTACSPYRRSAETPAWWTRRSQSPGAR